MTLDHRIDIDPLIRIYCERWSTSEHPLLNQIERHTHLNTVKRHDASDMIQGRLISFLSKIIQPKLILEIGTFTGYATTCLAEGLIQGGEIISIENDLKYRHIIEKNLTAMGISDQVDLRIGDALDIIPQISGTFDLVFIDAAKYEYRAYYDLVIEKLNSGGVIIADNTLWKGRVIDYKKDRMTQSMHAFNQYLHLDKRVEIVLLPYRDGISLIRKI